MASADKVPMLEEGHRKLNDELRRLRTEERPAIVEAIEAARAHGDLSENAEYHAAKERQGHIEAMIADLEDRLSRAMVIDPAQDATAIQLPWSSVALVLFAQVPVNGHYFTDLFPAFLISGLGLGSLLLVLVSVLVKVTVPA